MTYKIAFIGNLADASDIADPVIILTGPAARLQWWKDFGATDVSIKAEAPDPTIDQLTKMADQRLARSIGKWRRTQIEISRSIVSVRYQHAVDCRTKRIRLPDRTIFDAAFDLNGFIELDLERTKKRRSATVAAESPAQSPARAARAGHKVLRKKADRE